MRGLITPSKKFVSRAKGTSSWWFGTTLYDIDTVTYEVPTTSYWSNIGDTYWAYITGTINPNTKIIEAKGPSCSWKRTRVQKQEKKWNYKNVSLGSNAYNDDVLDAVNYAYENNVYLIAAVGDSDTENVLYPAKYDNSIAVQVQSKLGVKYLDASYGPEVDVRVPGEFIKVLTYEETDIGSLVTKYESGSSYSVAIFSGMLALKLSYQENDFTQTFEYIRNIDINDKFINVEKFVKGS